MSATSVLMLALTAAPQQPPPVPQPDPPPAAAPRQAAPAAQDVLVLRDHTRLEGTVVVETSDYVEIRIDATTTLGLPRSRIASIHRAGDGDAGEAAAAPVPESRPAPWRERDEWFLVHDPEGHVVGRLHARVAGTEAGGIRLEEDWELDGGGRISRLRTIEELDAMLAPLSCYWQEQTWSRGPDPDLLQERLLRATVAGGVLKVQQQGTSARSTREIGFGPGSTFPLALREQVRQRGRGTAVARVFDPRLGTVVERRVDFAKPRVVTAGGIEREVRPLRTHAGGRVHVDWIAAGATLRREANVQELAAVPARAERALAWRSVRETIAPASRVLDRSGRYALWLPHPGWAPAEVGGGGLGAKWEAMDASVRLLVLDHVDPEHTVDGAADAVERWLRLALADCRVVDRQRERRSGHPAIRLVAQHGERAERRAELWVFELGGEFLGLCIDAPRDRWAELGDDLERLRRGIDLAPADGGPPDEVRARLRGG